MEKTNKITVDLDYLDIQNRVTQLLLMITLFFLGIFLGLVW